MHSAVLLLSALFVAFNAAPIPEDGDLNEIEYFENNVGEEGEQVEGDMLLTPAQQSALYGAPMQRNGRVDVTRRWPNATVVYYIKEGDFDEDQIEEIEEAMKDIANKTCITFVPRKHEDEHAVTIHSTTSSCTSTVGFTNGNSRQSLNLGTGCFRHGTIVHEILHTLGFYHMQNSHDRNEFVKIVLDNVRAGMEHNFKIYGKDSVSHFGVPYDYNSVMHYPSTAFSINGEKTIIPLQEGASIGQRVGMSEGDILRVNRMYCDQNWE